MLRTVYHILRLCCVVLAVSSAVAGAGEPASKGGAEWDTIKRAYQSGRYQQAADLLRSLETTNGRAAGLTCELFVRRLVAQDDRRGAAACRYAATLEEPRGLYWYSQSGLDGQSSLGLQVPDSTRLANLARAAEQDFPAALGRLCGHYFEQRDIPRARSLCTFGSSRNAPEAEYYYGLMSLYGIGMRQDARKGLSALLLSAQAGFAPALDKLAEFHKEGRAGLAKDPVKAYAWAILAADAAPGAALMIAHRESLAKGLTAEEISRARAAASTWRTAAKYAPPTL